MTEAAFTARELAALQLERLPRTERGFQLLADREGWAWRERKKSGGGREYLLSSLPAAARAELAQRQLTTLPALPESVAAPKLDLGTLKDHQRRRVEARASIIALIDHLVQIEGHTRAKAVEAVVAMARAQKLPPTLQAQVPIANARANGNRTLTRATLFNWLKARDQGGGSIAALAPAAAVMTAIPSWASTFMMLFARPSKPSLTEVLDAWPTVEERPSYDQARRFLKRLDAVTRNKGRMGPRALKGLKAYVARDVSNLWPGAVFVGDGHTFKAEVAHPLHGRPFRPEVTAILDVYTRRWVGWSVALAENTWSVADALRHAVTTATCCDVFYYDNGAGAKNAAWDEPVTGFCARLGVTKLHSAPWSSQARGVIERFNSSVLHREARALPTYVGERMDKEARQAAFKITRRDVAAQGTSPLLISWEEFKALLDDAQLRYNARPHTSLPRDVAAQGRRLHQSPDEAWAASIAAGWTPEPISREEARELFRPAVMRSVQRGVVKLFNNAYCHPALEPLHGETVQVGFDLHDAHRVMIRLADGRFVCEAEWNANARDYVPVPFAERAREKRLEGRLKRLDAHREEALAEATPNLRLVGQKMPVPEPLTVRQVQAQADIEQEFAARERRMEIATTLEHKFSGELGESAEGETIAERVSARWAYALTCEGKPVDWERVRAAADDYEQRLIDFARHLDIEHRRSSGASVSEIEEAWDRRYTKLPRYFAAQAMYEDFGDAIFG